MRRSSIVVVVSEIVLILVLLNAVTLGRKPGKCPSQRHNGVCGEDGILECTTDNHCTGDEKCCMVRCAKRCVVPVPKPYIQVHPNKKTVDKHTSIKVGCYAQYQQFEGWYGPNGQKITSHSSDAAVHIEKHPKKDEWFLILKMIDIGGTYTCRGTMTNDEFRLRIRYNFDSMKDRQSLKLGENGVIAITVTGYPRPTYTWQKNGHPVDMTSDRFIVSPSGSLGIANVQMSDEGLYSLHVKQQDEDEVIKRDQYVNIVLYTVSGQCPNPVKHEIECKSGSKDACVNDTVCSEEKKCCFDGCTRKCAGQQWDKTKPGLCAPVIFRGKCSSNDYNLCGEDSDCKDKQKCCRDACKKRCVELPVISNFALNALNMDSTDQYFTTGQQVVKTCRVYPFEGWYDPRGNKITSLDGHVFVQSEDLYESALIINNVTAEDGGKYTCQGARETKSFNVNINITVHNKPVRQLLRPVKRIPLLIRTDIRGYPLPKYTWYKDGKAIDAASKEYSVAPSGSLGIANNGHQSWGDTATYNLKVEQEGRLYDPGINVEVQSDDVANDPASTSSGTSVECFKSEMRLAIKRELLGSIKANMLQLRDPRCKPKVNETHFLLIAPLMGCGTTVRHTDKAVVYSNAVSETKPKGLITRQSHIDVPFNCFYANEGITSTLGLLPRLLSKVLSGSNSSTNFVLSMALYKDKSFNQEFQASDFPLTIGLNEPLFIEVKVESPDNRLSVLTERCYATPNQNPLDKVTYDVIRKGCSMDPTLQFYDSRPSRKRFAFNSFQFVGVSQRFVFIHCILVVCNASDSSSRCAQGCRSSAEGKRQRRSSNSENYDFTQGPIIVLEERNIKGQSFKGLETTSSLFVWLFIGMAAICLVCLTSIIYMRRRLTRENFTLSKDSRETRL